MLTISETDLDYKVHKQLAIVVRVAGRWTKADPDLVTFN